VQFVDNLGTTDGILESKISALETHCIKRSSYEWNGIEI